MRTAGLLQRDPATVSIRLIELRRWEELGALSRVIPHRGSCVSTSSGRSQLLRNRPRPTHVLEDTRKRYASDTCSLKVALSTACSEVGALPVTAGELMKPPSRTPISGRTSQDQTGPARLLVGCFLSHVNVHLVIRSLSGRPLRPHICCHKGSETPEPPTPPPLKDALRPHRIQPPGMSRTAGSTGGGSPCFGRGGRGAGDRGAGTSGSRRPSPCQCTCCLWLPAALNAFPKFKSEDPQGPAPHKSVAVSPPGM